MVSLRRDSNGSFIARKRLPDDVREEYGRLYGARFEAKFSARAGLGKQVAQQKFHQWATEVEQRIEAIRKAQRREGLDLSREQAAALAGEWYLWFVARYEGDASDPVAYEEALWDIVDAMRDFAPDEVREHPRMYPDWEREPRGSQGDTSGARRHGAHDTIPCEPGYCPDEQRARPASGFCVGQLHSGTAAVAATSEGRLRTGRTPKIISQIRTGYTELMADGAYGEPGAQLEAPR
jgi:hypothetical protein